MLTKRQKKIFIECSFSGRCFKELIDKLKEKELNEKVFFNEYYLLKKEGKF